MAEERGLKTSSKNTKYLGCDQHQGADIHLHGEKVKKVNTFIDLGLTLRMLHNWMQKAPTEWRTGGRTGIECLEFCATELIDTLPDEEGTAAHVQNIATVKDI